MKKVVVLLAEGFEEVEALTVVDVLRRADVVCDMCSIGGQMVTGSHNITVRADLILGNADLGGYYVLVLPGGMPGAVSLRDNEKVVELVKEFNAEERIVAAICAAPIVLHRAGIIGGRKATSHPSVENQLDVCTYEKEIVMEDGNIITSRGPATAIYFALSILEKLGLQDKACELKKSMMLEFVEEKIRE